VSYNTNSC